MKNKFVVYKHISPSNKIYIGITGQGTNRRWRNGLGYKNSKDRRETPFWRAIKKYGWDNFKHEILFENLTEKEACEKEIELIDKYSATNPKYGYNISQGGSGVSGLYGDKNGMYGKTGDKCPWFGKKHTEEEKKKISEANKGKNVTDESILKTKESRGFQNITQLSLNGEYINTYISQSEALKSIGINKLSGQISKCCTYKALTAYGYRWMYEDDYKIKKDNYGNIKVQSRIAYNARKVDVYDINGNYINTYDSMLEASKQLKICDSEICNSCNGNRFSAKGHVFRYQGEPFNKYKKKIHKKEVLQFDINDILINEYESVKDAMRKTGVSVDTIGDCCKGKNNHIGKGYKWFFKNDKELLRQ